MEKAKTRRRFLFFDKKKDHNLLFLIEFKFFRLKTLIIIQIKRSKIKLGKSESAFSWSR